MEEQLKNLQQEMDTLRGQLAVPSQPARVAIKPPKFTGTGDVESFLDDFDLVREANGWNEETAAIHLRLSLDGSGRIGVRGSNFTDLKASLRLKYQLSMEEARTTLRRLRFKNGDSVHELGATISRLIKLAYPTLTEEQRDQEARLYLLDTISDKHLRREFSLQPPKSFTDALDRAIEYLRDTSRGDQHLVQQVALEEPSAVDKLAQTVASLATQVAEIGAKLDSRLQPRSKGSSNVTCFQCGQRGHIKRQCPQSRWQSNSTPTRQQGNGQGSSQ